MRHWNHGAGLALLLVALVLAGCRGGGAETSNEISTTTTGQQLMDLKSALDSGAVSQEEYQQQREAILEGN